MTPDYSALVRYASANPSIATNVALATAYAAATTTTRRRLLPISNLLQWGGAGPLDAIDAAQAFAHPNPPTQKAVRAACKAAIKMFGATDTFDLDAPVNRGLLGLFVAVAIMSQAESDSLLALGDVAVPLYSQPGEFGLVPTADDFAAIHVRAS